MKRILSISILSMILLASCGDPVDEYKHLLKPGKANVILITGQSNASGNSPWSFLETKSPDIFNKFSKPNEKVLTNYYVHSSNYLNFFEPTRFGMADHEKTFGPEIGIADVFSSSSTPTYIIKYAIGGTTLDNQWLDTKCNRGELYNDSIEWFKKQINYLKKFDIEPTIIGQFWMQGEGDSHSGLEYKYEQNLRSLISYYREDLKEYYQDHYIFVDAYISTKTSWPNPGPVNEGKQKVADSDPYTFCIKTNGEDETAINLDVKAHENEGDDLAHYSCLSEILLGQTVGKILLNK